MSTFAAPLPLRSRWRTTLGLGSLVLAGFVLAACIQQPPDDPPAQTGATPAPQVALADSSSNSGNKGPAVGTSVDYRPDPAAGSLPPAPGAEELGVLMKSPDFLRSHLKGLAQLKDEGGSTEQAPWFGQTGLSDEQERRLPRYVRMELGQRLGDAETVRAADLQFMGHFDEKDGQVYYWQLPPNAVSLKRATRQSPRFAYIRLAKEGGTYLDWGNRLPPEAP